jgi:hypothetical protein
MCIIALDVIPLFFGSRSITIHIFIYICIHAAQLCIMLFQTCSPHLRLAYTHMFSLPLHLSLSPSVALHRCNLRFLSLFCNVHTLRLIFFSVIKFLPLRIVDLDEIVHSQLHFVSNTMCGCVFVN